MKPFKTTRPIPPLLAAFQMHSCEPYLGKKMAMAISGLPAVMMLWAGVSTLSDLTQGSCMYLSWDAVSNSSEESSCCRVVLVWGYFLFTMILWTSTGFWNRMFASGKGDPYCVYYFVLRLAVCHRFPMLFICWRVHCWSLSLAFLMYDGFLSFICWGFVWAFCCFFKEEI